ncbi:unnamed protein product [Arctogadus glacialis]
MIEAPSGLLKWKGVMTKSHQTSAQNGATSFSQDCRGADLQICRANQTSPGGPSEGVDSQRVCLQHSSILTPSDHIVGNALQSPAKDKQRGITDMPDITMNQAPGCAPPGRVNDSLNHCHPNIENNQSEGSVVADRSPGSTALFQSLP